MMGGARLAIARAVATVALLLAAASAFACDIAHAPNTRWSVVRQHGVAWIVDPCGERHLLRGVDVVDAGASGDNVPRPHYAWQRFAPSVETWASDTRQRLLAWGFDSTGAWSLPPRQLPLPTVINLELGRYAHFHWFDPFDPATVASMLKTAKERMAPWIASPWRVGYFSDNEVGWWNGALWSWYAQKPASSYTKRHWVRLLRRLYRDDWHRFTDDFVPPPGVSDWRSLLAVQGITRLRPDQGGMAAVNAWTGAVASLYYKLSARAIHAVDPEALYLGDRLPIYYDPVAIRAELPYTDVIDVNYNVDSPEGWLARYFFDGLAALDRGKPIFVSEWFYAAAENRTGNRNNGQLMTVATQAERAWMAGIAARNFALLPALAGIDWFQYYDYPQGGRADGEDYDFGLVDIENRPYEALVASLAAANAEMPAIHRAAKPWAPIRLSSYAIPRATIDPAHHSLVDWPKPAALLPALKTARGDVAFGEVYLAWDENGLALAHIGQDYYDPDLLAYDGSYPQRQAYQVDFGVDAGAGAKRFTLYLMPPPRGAPEHTMHAVLCQGIDEQTCRPVPGGSTLYYGADQPRVVEAALVPWSAMGGKPAAGKLKFEVAVRSWYRARWMSLSGQEPAAGLADPAHWAMLPLR